MTVSYASARNDSSKKEPSPTLPVMTYTPWVRPADWTALPVLTSSDEKVAGLFAVFPGDFNAVALTASTSGTIYYVDWGDGVVQSYANNAKATHTYDYATTSGSPTTRGYKQVIIQIYAQGTGIKLSTVDFNQVFATGNFTNDNWLDISCGCAGPLAIAIGTTTNPYHPLLEQFSFNGYTPGATSFQNLTGLQSVKFNNGLPAPITTGLQLMFNNCTSLQAAPDMNTGNATSTVNMFIGCSNLRYVPEYNFANVTNASAMFQNCNSLVTVPKINLSSATDVSFMFSGCSSLKTIPLLNTANTTAFDGMFRNCSSLTSIPMLNTSKATSLNTMFFGSGIITIPTIDTSNNLSTANMFGNCTSLTTIPDLNLTKVTNSSIMFSGATELQTIGNLNLANVTNTVSMFNGCTSLITVGNVYIPNATITAGMFNGCTSLSTAPTLTITKVTNTSTMFQNCSSLLSAPTYDLSNVTSTVSMYANCTNLRSVGDINIPKATTANTMFLSCKSLTLANITTTSNLTSTLSMFNGANAVISLPTTMVGNGLTTAATVLNMFSGATSLANMTISNMRASFSVASTSMTKSALENQFYQVGNNIATGTTMTITSAYGADTAVAKTATWTTTSNSFSITVAGNVTANMYAYNASMNGTAAVTFTDIGDLVTLTFGGGNPTVAPVANSIVSFPTITTTTGITANTLYYVINPSGSTFQVSATQGGSALPLTTNGTGTVKWATKVTNVVGTTITLDNYPCANGTAATVNFRNINTFPATLKNWTVTG